VFPRAGVFVKRIGRVEIVADPNHVLFFRKNEPYRVAHPVGTGDECTVLAFASDLLTEAVAAYQPRAQDSPEQPFEFTHALSDQLVFLSQHCLRQQALSPHRDALALDELALEVLAAVTRSVYQPRGFSPKPGRSETLRIHREQARRACLLLSARYAENFGLAELASTVYASTFHLARLFKRATGLSLHQYRNRLRLRAALDRIVAGETDLTRLALDLGFSSHSHLTDLFHRAFGLPPSECRRSASSRKHREMSTNLKVPQTGLL
jgi:AraC-like DNA-binding protein